MKVSNQYFKKDNFRDMGKIGTLKCITCEEESDGPSWSEGPMELEKFGEWAIKFKELHDIKGCNREKKDLPEWVSGKIDLAINV